MLRLRPFRAPDAKEIITWTSEPEEFYKWSAGILGDFPVSEKRLLEAVSGREDNTKYFPLTAFDENGLAGFFTIRTPGEDDRKVRFGYVIVNPAMRGRGYGKEMLRLGLKFAFDIYGADEVGLGVFENNKQAYYCYKSVGFNENGKTEEYSVAGKNWLDIEMEIHKKTTEAELQEHTKMKLMATGNTAEVYEYGEGKVCKLFKDGYPLDSIKREFDNTLIMNRTSINAPKAYEIIEQNGRSGIVFDKISGTDLLSEYLKNPDDKKLAAQIIADLSELQKKLLSSESENGISYKDYLRWFGFEKTEELPDGKNICHGDLHPGNIIRTSENKLYLIDFMNVCLGPKEYDVARTYVLLTENNPADKEVGEFYLSLMEMPFTQIEPYLEAVYFCRKKEML